MVFFQSSRYGATGLWCGLNGKVCTMHLPLITLIAVHMAGGGLAVEILHFVFIKYLMPILYALF